MLWNHSGILSDRRGIPFISVHVVNIYLGIFYSWSIHILVRGGGYHGKRSSLFTKLKESYLQRWDFQSSTVSLQKRQFFSILLSSNLRYLLSYKSFFFTKANLQASWKPGCPLLGQEAWFYLVLVDTYILLAWLTTITPTIAYYFLFLTRKNSLTTKSFNAVTFCQSSCCPVTVATFWKHYVMHWPTPNLLHYNKLQMALHIILLNDVNPTAVGIIVNRRNRKCNCNCETMDASELIMIGIILN